MKYAVEALAKAPADRLLSSTSHEVACFILTVLHALTYVPLVLLPVLQDAHLKMVIVLNTTLCLCLMGGNVVFHFLGIVKVFPKMLDTFLLALYASMVPVVYLQFSWLSDWINVYHCGAVAAFMWLTIVLPCWDCFATESLRDRLPEELWELPAVKTAGTQVSLVWAMALTLCSIACVPPVLLTERHKWAALHIICDYVIVLVLLLAGGTMQWSTTARLLKAHNCSQQQDRSRRSQQDGVEAGDVEVGVVVLEQPGAGAARLHPGPRISSEGAADRGQRQGPGPGVLHLDAPPASNSLDQSALTSGRRGSKQGGNQ